MARTQPLHEVGEAGTNRVHLVGDDCGLSEMLLTATGRDNDEITGTEPPPSPVQLSGASDSKIIDLP